MALEELLPDDESMLNFWLVVLLKSKDISKYIDEASEPQREQLSKLLEGLRGSERRRHPRKSSFIPVAVNDGHAGIVKNISVTGAFIRVFLPLSVGQQITLNFPGRTKQEDAIKMTGEVMWTSAEGVGVQFASSDKDLEEVIKAL
jgi:hypothetical protein